MHWRIVSLIDEGAQPSGAPLGGAALLLAAVVDQDSIPISYTPEGMLKIILVISVCGGATVLLGQINIWLGVLALPILYGLSEDLLK